jgi:lysophospholipase L1-like esterase
MQTQTFSKYRGFFTHRLLAIHAIGLLFASITHSAAYCQQRENRNEHWVATWSTTLHAPELLPGFTNEGFNNQTVRQIVHISIGGQRVRLRLSTFGANALAVDAAHIALSAGDSTIVAGSDRTLTFGGKTSIVIPPGAPVVSDPVELAVSDLDNLAVSLFVSGATGPATWHFDSRQNSYFSPPGDFTGTTAMPLDPQSPPTQAWFWLAGIDVLAPRGSGAIAALGDSITDGDESSIDENHRWTDELARRIVQLDEHAMGVLNEGMDGNRLLHDVLAPNGLARFQRDVLSQPGLAYVIVYLGNGDIGTGWPGGLNPDEPVTADQIVQGYRQLIEAAHTRGVKIYGATLTPFKGAFVPGTPFPLYSPENEIKRRQVNHWIRSSGAFDAVIDFDRALRDPDAPSRLIPKYDSGDHVHANDDGYQAMANAINLRLFDGQNCNNHSAKAAFCDRW